MPSDELTRRALDVLADRVESYRSAVATAVDEVRALLASSRPSPNGKKGARAAAELGLFASARIDAERFEAFLSDQHTLDDGAAEKIEEALAILNELLDAGDDLYTVRVRPGEDLRDAVRSALARSGRAFGAGRAVENARAGVPSAPYADGFPPERWNRAERTVAPPLIVEVDGADLRPAGLADYLEGGQAIVLLVNKPAPPAALARLIAPGTLVVQAPGPRALDTLADREGPAIVAVVPEGAATFRYDPAGGGAGTLVVEDAPGDVKPLGGLSAARQEADLGLLRMLQGVSAAPAPEAVPAPPSRDPVDTLAAYLLRQAAIPEPGEG